MKKSVLQNIKSAFNLSYLALIVLFCFAISTSFMSINYVAKYLSTDGGFDGARVAKFEVDVEYSPEKAINISAENSTASYALTVKGSSEVNVAYKIILKFDPPVPEGVSIQMGDNTQTGDGTKTEFTFDGYVMPIGNEWEKEHTITFNIDRTKLFVSYNPEISIEVVAEQID